MLPKISTFRSKAQRPLLCFRFYFLTLKLSSEPLSYDDRWLRLTGIGVLGGFQSLGYFVFDNAPITDLTWARWALSLSAMVAFWEVNRLLIIRLRGLSPRLVRVAATIVAGILATALLNAFFHALRFGVEHGSFAGVFASFDTTVSFSINNRSSRSNYFTTNLINSTLPFLLFYGLYEVFFLIQETRQAKTRLQRAEQEKAALEKATLQSQLEALKQQVNPHFLFNALNSLGALIEDDPPQASRFLDELSSVYRYLLRSNDQPLTPLAAELEFIRSYFHLLQTRHGQGLQLALAVEPRYEAYRLPPLTLQLLVENAVKHNIVLAEQPLSIEIATDAAGQLVVENNLQRKPSRVLSNGVGLSNILTQYRMLGQPLPTVRDDAGRFIVRLPLVAPV